MSPAAPTRQAHEQTIGGRMTPSALGGRHKDAANPCLATYGPWQIPLDTEDPSRGQRLGPRREEGGKQAVYRYPLDGVALAAGRAGAIGRMSRPTNRPSLTAWTISSARACERLPFLTMVSSLALTAVAAAA